MQITFVAFNFRTLDIAAAQRHYADYHVALAKSVPGLDLYLTGRLRPIGGAKPSHLRAAIQGFASAEAAGAAMSTDATMKLIADTQENLTDLRLESFGADVVVPFAPRRGAPCFLLAAAFDFKPDQGDLAEAERNYKSRHVEIARKLPGLGGYLVARLGSERQRIAILAFDDFDHYRAAMQSPVGKELARDGEATTTNLRLEHIDARAEV